MFEECTIGETLTGRVIFEGLFDDLEFEFKVDKGNVILCRWIDYLGRGLDPQEYHLDQIEALADRCRNSNGDVAGERYDELGGILSDILKDGFKFDDNAEIMFGD